MPTLTKAIKHCKEIQAIVKERVEELKEVKGPGSGAVIAQLARAWDVLENRRRILCNRPEPKPIEVDMKGRALLGNKRKRGGVGRGPTVVPIPAPDLPANPQSSTQV